MFQNHVTNNAVYNSTSILIDFLSANEEHLPHYDPLPVTDFCFSNLNV